MTKITLAAKMWPSAALWGELVVLNLWPVGQQHPLQIEAHQSLAEQSKSRRSVRNRCVWKMVLWCNNDVWPIPHNQHVNPRKQAPVMAVKRRTGATGQWIGIWNKLDWIDHQSTADSIRHNWLGRREEWPVCIHRAHSTRNRAMVTHPLGISCAPSLAS